MYFKGHYLDWTRFIFWLFSFVAQNYRYLNQQRGAWKEAVVVGICSANCAVLVVRVTRFAFAQQRNIKRSCRGRSPLDPKLRRRSLGLDNHRFRKRVLRNRSRTNNYCPETTARLVGGAGPVSGCG